MCSVFSSHFRTSNFLGKKIVKNDLLLIHSIDSSFSFTNYHIWMYFAESNALVSMDHGQDIQRQKRDVSYSDLGPLKDNERRDLNCAVKEYLLLAGYRLTAMTFYEEVDASISFSFSLTYTHTHTHSKFH